MGVQADNAQIGQSGTNSQNFNIRTALDGVLRFSRGGKGVEISDPIKIEANNDVTLLGNLTSGALGLGQTWQDVVSGRVFGTTYTNTTGKAIALSASCTSSAPSVVNVVVGAMALAGTGTSAGLSVASGVVIIPAGSTYSVTLPAGTLSNVTWRELR